MKEDFMQHALTLESLASKGLEERFAIAVADLVENVRDPNTEAQKSRKITISIEVKPDAERRNFTVAFDVSTTLPRAKKYSMPGWLGRDPITGKPVIVAYDPQQGDMFRGLTPGSEHGAAGVVPMESARKAREG